jgi:hypothetical protein
MAAVVMLVISAILMTSASYAWSRSRQIRNFRHDDQVVTNENLEIALARRAAPNGCDGRQSSGNRTTGVISSTCRARRNGLHSLHS